MRMLSSTSRSSISITLWGTRTRRLVRTMRNFRQNRATTQARSRGQGHVGCDLRYYLTPLALPFRLSVLSITALNAQPRVSITFATRHLPFHVSHALKTKYTCTMEFALRTARTLQDPRVRHTRSRADCKTVISEPDSATGCRASRTSSIGTAGDPVHARAVSTGTTRRV